MVKNCQIHIHITKRQKEVLQRRTFEAGHIKLSKYIREKLELDNLENEFYE